MSKNEFSERPPQQGFPDDTLSKFGGIPVVEMLGLEKLSHSHANPRTFAGMLWSGGWFCS